VVPLCANVKVWYTIVRHVIWRVLLCVCAQLSFAATSLKDMAALETFIARAIEK
jgi:hypothetical protein